MTIPEAVILLEKMAEEKKIHLPLYVGIARAGSCDPLVKAGSADTLKSVNFGPPFTSLIVPAELHDMERSVPGDVCRSMKITDCQTPVICNAFDHA